MIQIREAILEGKIVGYYAKTIAYPYHIHGKEAFGSCRVEALENLLSMIRKDQEAIAKIAVNIAAKIDKLDGCSTEEDVRK